LFSHVGQSLSGGGKVSHFFLKKGRPVQKKCGRPPFGAGEKGMSTAVRGSKRGETGEGLISFIRGGGLTLEKKGEDCKTFERREGAMFLAGTKRSIPKERTNFHFYERILLIRRGKEEPRTCAGGDVVIISGGRFGADSDASQKFSLACGKGKGG